LVIDKIWVNDKTFVDETYNVTRTTQLNIGERLKLIADGKGLEVNFTVDDPGAFNARGLQSYVTEREPDRSPTRTTLRREGCWRAELSWSVLRRFDREQTGVLTVVGGCQTARAQR
jgi:hypothetical protein